MFCGGGPGGGGGGAVFPPPPQPRPPPRSMWNKCFGRRKRTTIFCTGCWGLAKTPRGRSAALSGELGGRGTCRGTARGSVATPPVPAQCVRRPGRGGRRNGYFQRLAWSKVGLLKTSAQSEHFATIKGVRAGSSRENLRFSSWMSDQYLKVQFISGYTNLFIGLFLAKIDMKKLLDS